VLHKPLAVLVLLIVSVSAFAQTDQAVKQAALDQRVRVEVRQFKGKVSLFAKNRYHPRGRIALAITCNEMTEVNWTVDNPALLLMSRLSEILVDGLGK
jgi:hypothetical protein